MTRWTLFILGESVDVTFVEMFTSIAQIVIIPVVLGFAIRYVLDRKAPRAAEEGIDVFPVVSVAAIVAGVVGANVENIRTAGALVLLAVVAHNGIGLGTGFGVGRAAGMSADRGAPAPSRSACKTVGWRWRSPRRCSRRPRP